MAKSEKLEFQTEVSQLLKLMINSVYSEKEVFVNSLVMLIHSKNISQL